MASLARSLRDAGAEPPPILVEVVDAVAKTAPLIRALPKPR